MRPTPRNDDEVAARRSVRGYLRWLVSAPGFGWRVAFVLSLVAAGAARGELRHQIVVLAVTLAVLLPGCYIVWRYRWWRQGWWPGDR